MAGRRRRHNPRAQAIGRGEQRGAGLLGEHSLSLPVKTCAIITFRAPAGRSAIRASRSRGRGLGLARQALRYALFRQGMLAMAGAPIRAFVCSREGLEAPVLMLGWIPMLTEPSPRGPRISRQSGLTLYAHAMRPESKGNVHITAADPRKPPAINFNFLSSPPDAELTVRAVRIAREIMTAPASRPSDERDRAGR